MSDLKNVTINELPFQENLEDTTIIHVSDGQDKQSTLSRVWEWEKNKIEMTDTSRFKEVVLTNPMKNKELEKLPLDVFYQETLGGFFNAIKPINKENLIEEGYSEVEVFLYEVARKSPFTRLGEYFYMDIRDNRTLEDFLESEEAQEYLLSFGITLANGENGSRDGRGVFLRAVDAGAGRESQAREIGQLQMDAMQKIWGNVGTTAAGDRGVFTTGLSGMIQPTSIGTPGWVNGTSSKYGTARGLSFDSSRITRTAEETRPKNINALLFQKVQDVDWRLILATPPKLPLKGEEETEEEEEENSIH